MAGPNLERLNKSGADLLAAIPLLVEGAEGAAAKWVPSSPTVSGPPAQTSSAARADADVEAPDAVRMDGGLLDSPWGWVIRTCDA